MTRLPPLVLSALALAVSLAFTWLIWDHETQAERHAGNARLDFALRGISDRIEQRALNLEQMLHGVQGLFATAKFSDRLMFREYVQALQLDANFSGIQAIGLVEFVPAQSKDSHEADMRSRTEAGIGIGGRLATPPLPHHRAYGSVPRRFDRVKPSKVQRFEEDQENRIHDFVRRVEPPGVRTCGRVPSVNRPQPMQRTSRYRGGGVP